jgi:ketosteroid isomerase-like protein
MAAFSDLHFQVHSAVADGARVTYAWTARGTHDGPLVTPSGTIPPSGRRGMVHGVLIATLEDGRIIREETYWNVLDLMAQIAPGAAAPPQAASAPSTAPARSEAVDLIRRCLDAFSAGDIPFFLSKVADDCTWSGSTSPEVPYAGQFTGPAGAGQFLDAIVGALDIKVFEFERLIGDGEHVVALGHWSGVARQTGRGFSARLALYFQVRDGRIVRTLGHEDTAVTAAALRA